MEKPLKVIQPLFAIVHTEAVTTITRSGDYPQTFVREVDAKEFYWTKIPGAKRPNYRIGRFNFKSFVAV